MTINRISYTDTLKESQAEPRWADKIVLFPLFVLVVTHLEIAGDFSLAGWAFLYRLLAMIMMTIYIVLFLPLKEDITKLSGIAFIIILYFVTININDISSFVIMATIFIFLGLFLGFIAKRGKALIFEYLLSRYLILNIIGLIIAWMFYYIWGSLFDLHALLFPFSAARIGDHLEQVRLSGFQIEPGSYANCIYIIVVLRSIIKEKIFGYLNSTAIISTIFTFSAWAPIGIFVFFLASSIEFIIMQKNKEIFNRFFSIYNFLASPFIIISFFILIYYVTSLDAFQFFNARYGEGDDAGSTEFKRDALTAWLGALDTRALLGRPMGDTFCSGCEAPQDLGTGFNMVFHLGVLPTIILFLIAVMNLTRTTNFAFCILVLPLFVTKYYYYDPLYWMVIGSMLFFRRRTSSKNLLGSRAQ